MNAKTAREQRRETKRTLGAKLEEFRDEERRRLKELEERVDRMAPSVMREVVGRELVSVQQLEHSEVFNILRRGFFGRLKWLLVGR